MTAVDAQVVARATIKSLQSTRSEASFELFWAQLQKFITDHKYDELKFIIVMPVTNAVSERSFSAMRCLLTYLRSPMSENRKNNSLVLHIHKEKLDNILFLFNIENYFVEVNVRRKAIFGKFNQSDLYKSINVDKNQLVFRLILSLSEIPQDMSPRDVKDTVYA